MEAHKPMGASVKCRSGMLLKLVASFLLLKLGKGELTEVLPSGDMQADPENYPYALRIVAYNTSDALFHHSCIAVLLTRSILFTSAHCVESQELSYFVKSYKVDELDMTPLLLDTFHVNGSAILVDVNNTSASYDDYAALLPLRFPVPLCQIDSEREYSVIKLPVADVNAKNWIPVADSSIYDDCIVLWYSDREEDEILHIYKCFAPKWYSGPLTASHTSVRNDESSYNGGVLVCRDGSDEYLVGMAVKSSADIAVATSKFTNENAATGDEDNFRSIHEALPQLKDRITELGKLQEMVVDGEMCDAFYGFNKEHLHT
uniref:Peptidase S1 domain-containing protein n=1 Tax=Ascaris lumbricoides TaxID=6252 RepID=A0A0M3ID34_ASCLU